MEKATVQVTDGKVAKRNRIIILVGAVGVLLLALVFANLTLQALNVRATTSSEFITYVAQHHIGRAELSEDFSKMQQDFCLLHVDHAIPNSELKGDLLSWVEQYYKLDGGHSLTVEYDIPGTNQKQILGDALYDEETKTVHLTMSVDGTKEVVNQTVNWPLYTAGS